jgi:hypothetical protein
VKAVKTIQISDPVHERLVKASQDFGFPISFIANKLLDEAMDNLIPTEEFRLTRPRSDIH